MKEAGEVWKDAATKFLLHSTVQAEGRKGDGRTGALSGSNVPLLEGTGSSTCPVLSAASYPGVLCRTAPCTPLYPKIGGS